MKKIILGLTILYFSVYNITSTHANIIPSLNSAGNSYEYTMLSFIQSIYSIAGVIFIIIMHLILAWVLRFMSRKSMNNIGFFISYLYAFLFFLILSGIAYVISIFAELSGILFLIPIVASILLNSLILQKFLDEKHMDIWFYSKSVIIYVIIFVLLMLLLSILAAVGINIWI